MRREWRKINTVLDFTLWLSANYGTRSGIELYAVYGVTDFFLRFDNESDRVKWFSFLMRCCLESLKANVKFYKDKNNPYVSIQKHQDAISLYYEFQPALSSFLQRHINRQKNLKELFDLASFELRMAERMKEYMECRFYEQIFEIENNYRSVPVPDSCASCVNSSYGYEGEIYCNASHSKEDQHSVSRYRICDKFIRNTN